MRVMIQQLLTFTWVSRPVRGGQQTNKPKSLGGEMDVGQKMAQNPPRQPSSSNANSFFDEHEPPRVLLRLRPPRGGLSRSLACGRKDSAAVASPAPSMRGMGGCPVDGKRVGFGGVPLTLTSDSSDSDDEDEDERS
jgi:hypothetical protein